MGNAPVNDSHDVTTDRDGHTVVVSDEIRVLVTAGEPLTRRGMARTLETQDDLDVVAVVPHERALTRVADHKAHVAVVLYEDESQVDLCRRLSLRHPPVGVVIADSFRSVRDLAPFKEAGVNGFVLRNSPETTHAEAVRAVAAGREYQDPHIPEEPPDPFGLTDREREVLSRLRPGCSNRDIADQLHVAEDTVKYHLKGIYGKFQIHSREEAMAIAVQEGIVTYRMSRRDP